ncbi:hypothetical protein HS041_22295 [Planomonospora sp. ID67723]|uniref:hypothetical protein n=1 Tax=Planomonospora sp. ID67723 TaxID=2738134 RepID=UPI0018C38787|nr:hypothetical protein [Planomonospora sp. ID67723]MBG0830495.1 hypothetical protein [Planomonospora sp. ID67723]
MQDLIRTSTRVPSLARARKRETAAEKLARAAQAAADVRAYDTNPDVIAYRIERLRARVDRFIWTGLIMGLAFTAANVQAFAAGDAPFQSIAWWVAWLLDPMVSLVLVGTLFGEQVIARHGITAGAWVRRTKWTALGATYAMNTWEAWTALDPAQILLHSVPPAIVFVAAEAITTLRLQITDAVRRAYDAAARTEPGEDRTGPVREATVRRAFVFRTAPRTEEPVRIPTRTFRYLPGIPRTEEPRPLRIVRAFQYQPRTAGEADRTADRTETAPVLADRDVFVRTVTGEILAAAERGDRWGPDYAELMARTGRSKSWCEKAVRAARTAVFRTDARTEAVA